ncbi:MAG: PD-(D/E)XK nuclease family protein [bacterium]|nr:PD-(D/E)XK nuclease family protein [bacterium]
MENKLIRLSPTSGLNLYRDCPRCFWLAYNERVHRPRGIFPSLPGGMDLVIKDYFDNYRGSLPPELEGKVEGVLMPDAKLMNTWRNWRTGLIYRDEKINAELFGALDDCMVLNDKYIPLDYKTRGSAPREGDSEKYYRTQLDSYSLLLEANGYPSADFAYLVYYYPKKVGKNGIVEFEVKPVKVEIDHERVRKLFEDAVNFLRKDPLPAHHSRSTCEYCLWNNQMLEFD